MSRGPLRTPAFKAGDRVRTVDGPLGTVDERVDGPHPGNWHYRVTLASGMGGGEYRESDLEPADGGSDRRAATGSRADEDYPDLAQVLADNPPLQVIQPHRHHADSVFDWMNQVTPEQNRYDPETGSGWSRDWCAFRQNQRCMYPKRLDAQATAREGRDVWIPEDRGHCPRDTWAEQQACPAPSAPGPHSGDPDYSRLASHKTASICPNCDGTGTRVVPSQLVWREEGVEELCDRCWGTGKLTGDPAARERRIKHIDEDL